MHRERERRRLSAILIADVAGYTRLVEQDTDGTVAAWKAARDEVIEPAISEHDGRLVKLTGDGFLSEFPSVHDAVTCALAIQDNLTDSPLGFRIGIHLGDVIDDGKDIHGEGVNIAARIEALADPGGVNVTGSVHEQVRNRLNCHFEDMGEHEVKHVSAPVRVYRMMRGATIRTADVPDRPAKESPVLPDKPSIAVLPFHNASSDAEQEYFADGMTEDIITELSRFDDDLISRIGQSREEFDKAHELAWPAQATRWSAMREHDEQRLDLAMSMASKAIDMNSKCSVAYRTRMMRKFSDSGRTVRHVQALWSKRRTMR